MAADKWMVRSGMLIFLLEKFSYWAIEYKDLIFLMFITIQIIAIRFNANTKRLETSCILICPSVCSKIWYLEARE